MRPPCSQELTRVCCTERFSACVLLKPIFAWVCLFNVQKHLVWKHYSLNAFRPELKEACYCISNLLSMWNNWAVKDEVKKQLPQVSPFYSCLFHAGVFHNVIFHKTYFLFCINFLSPLFQGPPGRPGFPVTVFFHFCLRVSLCPVCVNSN